MKLGEEHPAEVVQGVVQRGAAGVGQPGAGEGRGEQLADGGGGDRAVLGADPALEQHRGRRQPGALVVVVGRDQGDGRAVAAGAGDDGAEHVGEFGADDQQPPGVGLGRGDLQQRDQLAGGGQPVLDQAVVAELDQFPDLRGAEGHHRESRSNQIRPEYHMAAALPDHWPGMRRASVIGFYRRVHPPPRRPEHGKQSRKDQVNAQRVQSTGQGHPKIVSNRSAETIFRTPPLSAGDLCQPSGPDGEGQARGQARSARGEPLQPGTCQED